MEGMTKKETRAFIRRAREALTDLDTMLTRGSSQNPMPTEDWILACNEALGAVTHVQDGAEAGAYWLTQEEGAW